MGLVIWEMLIGQWDALKNHGIEAPDGGPSTRLLVILEAPDGSPSTRVLVILEAPHGVQAHDFWSF